SPSIRTRSITTYALRHRLAKNFLFASRRRHTRCYRDWSSDVCSSDLTSLAWVQFAYDWDWEGAERSYRRALELSPGYATGHHWYSFVLLATGQAEQALVEAHTALELDPSSLSIRRGLGWLYYYPRRYESAVCHLRPAI